MGFGIRELLMLITAALIGWPCYRVLSRLGFSPWLGVFVPIVNIIALWLFAYASWPALRK